MWTAAVWLGIVASVGGLVLWLYARGRSAGKDAVVVDAQKEVIDEQAKVQAARIATADPTSDRADRLRDRFTRK